jgi:hypothetical protein
MLDHLSLRSCLVDGVVMLCLFLLHKVLAVYYMVELINCMNCTIVSSLFSPVAVVPTLSVVLVVAFMASSTIFFLATAWSSTYSASVSISPPRCPIDFSWPSKPPSVP